ncbi:hypothetical protein [Spirosoma pulveris]
MFEFEIGGNEIKPEASEGIAQIPYNRTLLAQKLTQQDPINPEVVYGLKTVAAVFEKFEPSVEVEFESLDGMPTKEVLKFRSVADFRSKDMIANSPFLRSQDAQFKEYAQINDRLKSHRILQTALNQPEAKAAMIQTLQALIAELEANEEATAA